MPTPAIDPQRRRERELASLYATARSLTVLQEVDDVLAAIVRNAHDLMGTDITYLSVLDEDELTLRAAEGAVSSAFRAARVKPTIGVAGHAIRSRTPYWVANYRASEEIVHDASFDDVLSHEGLIALLGVPLIANDRVLGVLYAANREERPFAPEEVALLSAFADHAAVALENARLYDQRSRALSELTGAYSTIASHVEVMERSAAVHEALTRLVLSGGEAADVAALVGDTMRGDVLILDRDDRVLVARTIGGGAHELEGSGGLAPELVAAIAESRRSGRAVAFTTAGGRRCDVAAIAAGETYLGALTLTQGEDDLRDVDVRTVERAAQIMGLLTLQQDAVVEAEERVRGELLTELLTSTQPLTAQQLARGRARHLELDALTTLIAVQPGAAPGPPLVRTLRRIARERGGLAGEHLGTHVLLVPGDDTPAAVRDAHAVLSQAIDGPLLACATTVDPAAEPMGRSLVVASRCCRLLAALGVEDRAATAGDLALYAMVFDPDREEELQLFLQESLGPLLAYDAKGRADLLRTLSTYYANSGNLTRTARALHVHMNTLLKRLDRVASLIGQDWQDADRSLRLHLAVRLRELALAGGV